MDAQYSTPSTSSLIFHENDSYILTETPILENFFNETIDANISVILTLTKNHLIVYSATTKQLNKFFTAEINFNLKFETIYFEQKDVCSKKIGIKFFVSHIQCQCFYSADISIIELWIFTLSKIINQTGFHEHFKPIKKLGQGSCAMVYEVERRADLKRFAVKAFSKTQASIKKNGMDHLINEISVLKNLNHQNVLKLQSVFQSENSIYVVLQILTGNSLYNRIKKANGFFFKIQIKTIMKGLLEGLDHIHENRIAHRDLKLENIMLKDENSLEPIIIDFDMATNVDIPKYLFFRCGTPGYVAPQIISLQQNVHIEPKCDIFSLGVIFHLLLMRKPLFQGTAYNQVHKNNKQMKFDLNSTIYQRLEYEQIELLKKMLLSNPAERISAKQALNDCYFDELRVLKEQKQLNESRISWTSQKNASSDLYLQI